MQELIKKKGQKWEEEATGEAMETAAAATNAADRAREDRSEEKRRTRGSSSERKEIRGRSGSQQIWLALINLV
jgi:hypothetical protein